MAQGTHQGRPNQNRREEAPRQQADTGWRSSVRFATPDAELFNSIAKKAAQSVAHADPYRNKPTQLRRFYDELLLWETRVSQQPLDAQSAKFAECLPFIRMLNAKAAYAVGRKLVDRTFVDLLQHTLNEITNPQTLTTCKYFWEAFMGFYKQERQD
ncbi:MAG TPA: type III-A CRISPR-associated protein Csm2 [Thiobacillaceae bacterium]|nr:type III-A CRISPR-associated protein Csm2 [Thiobacillaceae bacterium]HNU63508.1 type III-A CRISPR-associated protein Csm2 [Thiobacillaceae bacterium]